jgi:hypothetical protein
MKKVLLATLASTFALGLCSLLIHPGSARASDGEPSSVTFCKDVAPILFRNCVECHRPGELAPMSLLTYKDARPWARSIREKVVSREMPPWHADPHFGQFSNDRRLGQEEVDTIVRWVDQGAPEGNSKDLPRLPDFVEGWSIGKPDLVLSMDKEYTIEAKGSDEYINFVVPTHFADDRWVQAVEVHPGNKKVVHHAVAFIQTPQIAAMAKGRSYAAMAGPSIFMTDGTLKRVRLDAPVYDDGCSAPMGGFAPGSGLEALGPLLGFYAPGKDLDSWPGGTAKLIPAGSNIVLQMHYSKTTGKVEKDRTSVGLAFAKEPPERALMSFGALNHYFKIPAGDDNHEVTACHTFSRDVKLVEYFPHMHVRGKDMKYEILYPDGRRETLLFVKYNFNWQTLYRLKEPVSIPKGSKFLVTAHFDNSERNKYNPDPSKTVRFGDPTYDEMMIGYFDFVSNKPDRLGVKLDVKTLDEYAGKYQIVPGLVLEVTRDGNRLFIGGGGVPNVEIFPESSTEFVLREADALITFVKDDKGEVTGVNMTQNGRSIRFKKQKPDSPSALLNSN